ncbi:MAG: hypothetical protein M0P12_02505 [Paludibacteraceae bacterium]|nr:hypothetical protein [Paludibacteraceae bacterium]
MLLYSGPTIGNKRHKLFISFSCNCHCKCQNLFNQERVACVYTGDADLNKTKISSIFGGYWNQVGTIQIPHHGDIKAFNPNELSSGNYFCPISYGSNNSYGHPSTKVISEILSYNSCPISITENPVSIFIEIIK